MKLRLKDVETQLTGRAITGEPITGVSRKDAAQDVFNVLCQVETLKKEGCVFIYANGLLTAHKGTYIARIDIAAGSDTDVVFNADFIYYQRSFKGTYKDAYLMALAQYGRQPYDAIILFFLRDII
jgi:hypothetical protein